MIRVGGFESLQGAALVSWLEKSNQNFWKKIFFLLSFDQGCQMVYVQTKNPSLGKF
jgi:hypothetical protein